MSNQDTLMLQRVEPPALVNDKGMLDRPTLKQLAENSDRDEFSALIFFPIMAALPSDDIPGENAGDVDPLSEPLYLLKPDEQDTSRSDRVTIGRLEGSDVVLENSSVSSRHAILQLKKNRYFLKDYRSTNGTLINGKKIPPGETRELREGDEIFFGSFRAVFLLPGTLFDKITGNHPQPKGFFHRLLKGSSRREF